MRHEHHEAFDANEVTDYGSTGTSIKIFIDKDTAPNFIMRRFEIEPGGHIGLHSHDPEHEIFILSGEVHLVDENGNKELVKAGEFVYVPSNEPHGYENQGSETVAFICVVPK